MITPIFIPISSGRHNNEPDNKCPKCGHEWNDESVPMSLSGKLFVTAIVSIVLYFIVGAFDCFNGGIMYNAIFVRSVDKYEMPEGWEILSNAKGRFVIKKRGYYLTRADGLKLKLSNYPDIYPPLKCTSEKRAKSTLKYYLEKRNKNEFK